jgi:hypothetical protein
MNKITTSAVVMMSIPMLAWAEEVSLQLSAPSAVAVGDKFRIEYVLNTQGTDFRCDLESAQGVRILAGPSTSTSQSISIINGQRTSSVRTSFSYYVTADHEGTVTLPAASVKVGDKTYTSRAASLKVLPADESSKAAAQSGSNSSQQSSARQGQSAGVSKEDVQLDIALSKTSVYEGEPVLASVKLYFKNQRVSNISEVKLPDFEGFTVQDIDVPENQQAQLERYKGANYSSYLLKQSLLYPQHAGTITIPSATLTADVQVVVSRRAGGFFDFPMDYTQTVQVPATSAAKTITVKPLPAGKPASFLGGVGNFTMKAQLSRDRIQANEALTYRIEIEGTGNLKYMRDPQPEFPADFEVYDPKVDLNVKATTAGVSGKKVIEYTLIPRYAGTFQIPAVEMSYFDPKSGTYKTLTTEAFTLTVDKGADGSGAGGNGSGVSDFSGTNQERLKMLGSDIRYRHPLELSDLRRDESPLYGTLAYWLFFLVPALAFLILAVIYRRQLRLNADLDLKRTRGANKVAVRRLKEAAAALRDKNVAQFYASVHKSMLGYVSDKLRIPMSELSRDNVEQRLAQHGATDEQVQRYVEVLSTCEYARYAPSDDARAMDDLYARATAIINDLEVSLKK